MSTPEPLTRTVRAGAALCAILFSATFVSGCAAVPMWGLVPGWGAGAVADVRDADALVDPDEELYAEDLVLVVFALEEEFGSEQLLDSMWPVEERALTAIESAGLGYLDGNEVGGSEYSLFFSGDDREAMWELLQPIMATAPYPLDRVELWPPGEDAEPRIISFGEG